MKTRSLNTFFLISTLSCIGKKPTNNCNVLTAILENKTVAEHFFFQNRINDTLIIADTFHLFAPCKEPISGRSSYTVINKIPDEAKKGERSYESFKNRPHYNVLVVQAFKQSPKKFQFTIWQAKDNAVITLSVNKINHRIRVISAGIY